MFLLQSVNMTASARDDVAQTAPSSLMVQCYSIAFHARVIFSDTVFIVTCGGFIFFVTSFHAAGFILCFTCAHGLKMHIH